MQCRIERTVLHLEKIVRRPLYVLADLMTVSRAIEEGPQYEHVQGPLEKSYALLCLFFHRRHSTLNLKLMVDLRLSIFKGCSRGGISIDAFRRTHARGEKTLVAFFSI